MARLNLDGLSPMQAGRVAVALDKLWRIGGEVMTLRQFVLASEGRKRITDGACDYNRHTFNRMNNAEQRAYEARLAARRYYILDDVPIAKIVWDCVTADDDAGEAEALLAWTDADSLALFGEARP